MGNLCCKQSKIDPDQIQNLQNQGKLTPQKAAESTNMDARLKDIESKLQKSNEELIDAKTKIEKTKADAAQRIASLESQLAQKDKKLNEMSMELERYRLVESSNSDPSSQAAVFTAKLKTKDETILDLTRRLEKHESERMVELEQLNKKMELVMDEKDHQLKRLNALGAGGGNLRTAISSEPTRKLAGNKLPIIEKTHSERSILEKTLISNAFMRNLNKEQLHKLIDAMEKKNVVKDIEIIREGMDGTHMYILEKGQVQVSKGHGVEKEFVCDLGEGSLFGELAILYNCRRTATITTKTPVTLWSIERTIFQTVVQSAGRSKDQERFDTLRAVKDLNKMSEDKLRKIADCLEEESFEDGQCIIKQGTKGDIFFIIRDGEVRITTDQKDGTEKEVARLGKAAYFGEAALIKEDVRNANVYSIGHVQCYTLDRTAFTNLVGNITDVNQPEKIEEPERPTKIMNAHIEKAGLDDLQIVKALGAGGFGLVKLVKVKGITDRAFALKCIQKARVVQYGQQRHIMDEKNILVTIDSKFILRLHKTYKDKKFVYLLTDAYMGGDLWRTLHTKGPFNDNVARFYVACVVEAFDYLHKRQYVYRDLKPENLMVDNNGYIRLVDLGFAKKILAGHKTWTFCGTPEYICPEIISNTGHTIAADYWSLGILIFELLSKRTPFRAKDDLAIYEGILRGIGSVQFPYKISRKAESIIKSLCRQDPSERLGYQKGGIADIKKHRWYQGFDWDGLQQQRIVAPHIPDIKDVFDVSNFEKLKEEDLSKIPEETSGWDENF